MRTLWIRDDGAENAEQGFARSQLQAALAASRGLALLRLHRRSAVAVSLGRFHRMAAGRRGLERRLTGGRALPIGPGVLGLTLAVPGVDWLDPTGPGLRPDQILNRFLRPVLSTLRSLGVDVFYPGRDLLTVDKRIVGVASFTIAPDGVCMAEAFLALEAPFSSLPSLLSAADPDGVAVVDADQYQDAVALESLGRIPERDGDWVELLTASCSDAYRAHVEPWPEREHHHPLDDATPAFRAFQEERGRLAAGCLVVSSLAMLGVVEASAFLRKGVLHDLTITGDLLAPFHTLDEISRVLEGHPPRPPLIRRKLTEALAQARSFVLGIHDLDELITRLGS